MPVMMMFLAVRYVDHFLIMRQRVASRCALMRERACSCFLSHFRVCGGGARRLYARDICAFLPFFHASFTAG